MSLVVHHQPLNSESVWNLHAWQLAWDGNAVWDPTGTAAGDLVNFRFPDVPDPRKLNFKFRSRVIGTNTTAWEPDDFIRQIVDLTASEMWTFPATRRILYREPNPPGVTFRAGDALTFRVITQSRFRGGSLYAWNPYGPSEEVSFFPETSRDDAAGVSTFVVTLADWMTAGFHLKLIGPGPADKRLWEPDASNRVWRPCDGTALWLKSGQCDVRSQPLTLTALDVEVLMSAALSPPPSLTLQDVTEEQTFAFDPVATRRYAGNSLFQVATYRPSIYPQAGYNLQASGGESPPINRPFPANPADLKQTSRFALGAGAWVKDFPPVTTANLVVVPLSDQSFSSGLNVVLAIGNSVPYATLPTARGAEQNWKASIPVAQSTTTSVRLSPVGATERTPYAWIDTGRYFTPSASAPTYFTTEGVFGVTTRGKTAFAEPPPGRQALMASAFGPAVVASGVFGTGELPHGATIVGDQVYFVVHAPHAVYAILVLVPPGATTRREVPMSLTKDTLYWWCAAPLANAPAGTRYHFVLNDDLEVIDPAAREVRDSGGFDVPFNSDPNDASISWSLVLDVAPLWAAAHAQPWQTMGWETLLVYEMHAQRFTDKSPSDKTPLELLADELQPISRLDRAGYLWALPVTAFELLPVQEFRSAISWGYDPSFYFAVDGHYGGSMAFAKFVNAAHAAGRAVLLDVVYNHSLGSPLMKIAPDVYRNGDYDGDRMNCGHPMVGEFLRQATIYFSRMFNLDGFRFDDTRTIVTQCQGGWEFLGMIRWAVRTAASAEGRHWPYCVAENSATNPWDISNPVHGVMDGQWHIDEVYRIRDASYDVWHPGWDDAGPLRTEMNNPAYFGRPFYQATRYGESHDMVSEQDAGNKRIAARPPFGQGRQLAKALGTLTLLSNGVPMLFMGQETGETRPFSFDNSAPALNPQDADLPPTSATDSTRVLAWFRQLMGLRNDALQGLQGELNYQVVQTGNRTIAFTCGREKSLFVVVTFGTPDQQQDSSWLGLPTGIAYKEIFNSSWPVFQVEFEPEHTNGSYDARIRTGQILQLPFMGAVVLQRT
ncbi:MAG: alpha-amylase family glycosyl hydrolase [Thermoguttaceae bacterium]|jgi:1,4-alpha-glucan branching enzyme